MSGRSGYSRRLRVTTSTACAVSLARVSDEEFIATVAALVLQPVRGRLTRVEAREVLGTLAAAQTIRNDANACKPRSTNWPTTAPPEATPNASSRHRRGSHTRGARERNCFNCRENPASGALVAGNVVVKNSASIPR